MRLPLLLILLLLSDPIACDRRPPLVVRKETLAVMPLDWRRPSVHVANDGKHVTFTARDRDGYHVVTPTGRGATYGEVSLPLFAPESSRVYYWARTERDGRTTFDVVADGTPWPTPFVEPSDITYPPGGARWATLGFLDDPSGARRQGIVVDGVEMGQWTAASRPAFSADGTHVAWLTRDASGRATLVVDGTSVRGFDAVPPSADGPRFDQLAAVRYLADGRLLVIAPEGAGWTVYRGDERLAAYGQNLIPGTTILLAGPETTSSIVSPSLVTAAKAPVAVWWERMPGQAERWRVVRDGAAVDGIVCDRYWDTQPPVLTEDGQHVAYVCPTPTEAAAPLGRRWVVLDGRRFGTYIETWTLGIANDGNQVAYGAAETLPILTWRIFANGVPKTAPHELVWRPRFAPDGGHLFWAGGPEKKRRALGIDQRVVTRFDDVMYGPEFPSNDTAVWVIRRGRKLSRIEARY